MGRSHFVTTGTTSLLAEQTKSSEKERRMLTSIALRSSGQHLNQARAVVLPLPNFHRAVIFAKTLYLGVAIHGLFMIGQEMERTRKFFLWCIILYLAVRSDANHVNTVS